MSPIVAVLPSAGRDVRAIYLWLRERSPNGADSWFHAWEDLLDRLPRIADSSVRAPEDELIDIEIRQAIFKTRKGRPYRALFTIHDDSVYIMHVRGPRQNLMAPDEIVPPSDTE